jgi:hypothetical protein
MIVFGVRSFVPGISRSNRLHADLNRILPNPILYISSTISFSVSLYLLSFGRLFDDWAAKWNPFHPFWDRVMKFSTLAEFWK